MRSCPAERSRGLRRVVTRVDEIEDGVSHRAVAPRGQRIAGWVGACARATPGAMANSDTASIVRLFSMQPHSAARAELAFVLPPARCPSVALKEVVEEGPDHRDDCDPADRLPARRNRRFDDIGRQLEGERGDQPSAHSAARRRAVPWPGGEPSMARRPPKNASIGGDPPRSTSASAVDDRRWRSRSRRSATPSLLRGLERRRRRLAAAGDAGPALDMIERVAMIHAVPTSAVRLERACAGGMPA